MIMSEKLNFAFLLVDEIVEDVYANYGSPPFPEVGELERIKDLLTTFFKKVVSWEDDGYR